MSDIESRIQYLSFSQLYALHVASHYKLKRSSMGWWAENHPRWGVTEVVPIFSPATIKSLWKNKLLDGIPDAKILGERDNSDDIRNVGKIGLWTNQRGKQLISLIENDTGFFYNLETDELASRRDAWSAPTGFEGVTLH